MRLSQTPRSEEFRRATLAEFAAWQKKKWKQQRPIARGTRPSGQTSVSQRDRSTGPAGIPAALARELSNLGLLYTLATARGELGRTSGILCKTHKTNTVEESTDPRRFLAKRDRALARTDKLTAPSSGELPEALTPGVPEVCTRRWDPTELFPILSQIRARLAH
jgi:hypothetical protein